MVYPAATAAEINVRGAEGALGGGHCQKRHSEGIFFADGVKKIKYTTSHNQHTISDWVLDVKSQYYIVFLLWNYYEGVHSLKQTS